MSRNDSNWVASNIVVRKGLYKMKRLLQPERSRSKEDILGKKAAWLSKVTSLQEMAGL